MQTSATNKMRRGENGATNGNLVRDDENHTLSVISEDDICSTQGVKPRRQSKIGQQLSAAYNNKYDTWLRSFGLKPCWEVPKDVIEIYIWHGYRPNPSSIVYCLKSAFYPSNETLNVWTHFIPCLLLLWRLQNIFSSFENPTAMITYPFWIYSFGCCFIFLLSACAHLFNCHSAMAQEFCFCLDYGGIFVFGLSSAICIHFYICSYGCFVLDTEHMPLPYPYVILFMVIVSTYVSCQSRFPNCRAKYLMRFMPGVLSHVVCTFPCAVRFSMLRHHVRLAPSQTTTCQLGEDPAYWFFFHIFSYLVAVAFVAFRFPEKWKPGHFDIVGNSHQWFHIFTALGMYCEHLMAEDSLRHALALIEAGDLDEDQFGINEWTTIVPMVLIVLAVLIISCKMAIRLAPLVHENRKQSCH
ncbi:unnamed protein product [Clavelina lepadiformis]|uniref:Uncharacterized protein n=1 Tax=Clavelina lepadiformis TaxID=159417 RepID=A0ABP0EUZ6_CLALP